MALKRAQQHLLDDLYKSSTVLLKLARAHIVDGEEHRRTSIASENSNCGRYAAVYDSLHRPLSGLGSCDFVLANDDQLGLSADTAVRLLSSTSPIPAILYLRQPSAERIVATTIAGAVDYLEWPFDYGRLKQSISWPNSACAARPANLSEADHARELVAALNAEERQVLRILVNGGSLKDIARTLSAGPSGAKLYRTGVMQKLNATTTADVVRVALMAGTASPMPEFFKDGAT